MTRGLRRRAGPPTAHCPGRPSASTRRSEHMFPYDYLLAAALLTGSPDLPGPDFGPDAFAAMRLPLQALAVEWEVLDPREVRYVLVRPEDFASDLSLLRRRYRDLADSPPVCD